MAIMAASLLSGICGVYDLSNGMKAAWHQRSIKRNGGWRDHLSVAQQRKHHVASYRSGMASASYGIGVMS